MNLRACDGLGVRITDLCGDEYEGICAYNSAEYNMHEFGRAADGLQIGSFLFYSDCITKVELLDWGTGPYGGFSAPFGRIESLIVEEGPDAVCAGLESEEPVHVCRLLHCLEERLFSEGEPWSGRGSVIAALRRLAEQTPHEQVRAETERILAVIEAEKGV